MKMKNETLNMNRIKPYEHKVIIEDIWNYRPEDESTHTSVPILNAVAEALYSTNIIEIKPLAEGLQIDPDLLSKIVKFELDIKLIDLLHQYRFRQVSEYVAANPKEPLETVAQRFGYSSYGSLWRFMQRIGGVTPDGKKSNAGPELWLTWREEYKKRRGY